MSLQIEGALSRGLWHTTTSLVVAWMMSSMSPTIAGMVKAIHNAVDMWKMLAKMNFRVGNLIHMVEVQTKIENLKQGEKCMLECVAELLYLWSDLDHYDPFAFLDTTCAALGKKWIERRRVTHFQKGLNAEFEHRIATMCDQSSLPTIEEAIAAMTQEEVRLKVMTCDTSPTVWSALVDPGIITNDRECYNCERKGISVSIVHNQGTQITIVLEVEAEGPINVHVEKVVVDVVLVLKPT